MLAVTVILVLHAMGLGVALAKHGQLKRENHNFFVSFLGVVTFWTCVWWLDCPIFS